MFGYVVMNKPEIRFKDFDLYRSFYCGLCRELREKYGISGQITLTYDMTFVVVLLSALYEPPTQKGTTRCVIHPVCKHPVRKNAATEYGADMNVLLSYYKCMDDWADEKKLTRFTYAKLLKKGYHRAYNKYPEKARRIENLLRELSREEKKQSADIDRMAGIFGRIMSEVLAPKADEWEESLRNMGFYLGKFIYLLDAYEDVYEDRGKGRYNPFTIKCDDPDFEEEVRTILTMMMAECSREFEKLPILDNVEILRNIIYSGVWYRYEAVNQKRANQSKCNSSAMQK
mgnify:CR=1 FL=1